MQQKSKTRTAKGGYSTYKHLVSGNLFGIAERIKEERKNPRKRRYADRKKR